MDVRSAVGFVLTNGARTQQEMSTLTARLASGLRVTTAADDPSGIAIASNLATTVSGLDQGVRDIQIANNAITVADGALSAVSSILDRMRALVVQARSDTQSAADKANIQRELDTMRVEIDRIAATTSFNGRLLLDGSASSVQPQPARALLVENPTASGGGNIIDTTFDPNSPYVSPGSPQVVQSLSVDSYDPVADALNVTITIGSQDPSFGPEQTATVPVGNGTNYPVGGFGPTIGTPTFVQTDQNGNPVLGFNIGTLTPTDVGKDALLVTLPAQQKAAGNRLEINTGNAEGSIVTVDLGGASSVNLGVNQVTLGDDLENQAAEYRIDYAISEVGSMRASMGVQGNALEDAASNASVESVNTAAAESAIRDLDIGSAVTEYTRDQVLTQFQTTLVSDANRLSQGVTALVAASGLG